MIATIHGNSLRGGILVEGDIGLAADQHSGLWPRIILRAPSSRIQPGIPEPVDQSEIMCGDHDRRAHPVQLFEQLDQADADIVVHIPGRLVGEQQVGLVDHRPRDGDALLLAAGKRGRFRGQPVAQADPPEQFGDMLPDVRAARTGDAQRQGHVVDGRQVVEQLEILVDHPDAPAQGGDLVARQGRDIAAEQMHQAPGRPQGQVDQAHQRGFAGAAFAGQEMETARFEAEDDIAEHLGPGAVAHTDLVEPHDRFFAAEKIGSQRNAFRSPGRRPRRRAGGNAPAGRLALDPPVPLRQSPPSIPSPETHVARVATTPISGGATRSTGIDGSGAPKPRR